MKKKKPAKKTKTTSRKSSGKKPKPLPPTMRIKKRYIFFQLSSEKPLNLREVNLALMKEFSYLFGSHGLSKMNLQLIEFNGFTGKGILRCSRNKLEEAKTGLLFIKTITGSAVSPKILKVSGTLKKLRSGKK